MAPFLPEELLVHIVEALVDEWITVHHASRPLDKHSRQRLLHTLAALRETSKTFCRLVDPHFYNVFPGQDVAVLSLFLKAVLERPRCVESVRVLHFTDYRAKDNRRSTAIVVIPATQLTDILRPLGLTKEHENKIIRRLRKTQKGPDWHHMAMLLLLCRGCTTLRFATTCCLALNLYKRWHNYCMPSTQHRESMASPPLPLPPHSLRHCILDRTTRREIDPTDPTNVDCIVDTPLSDVTASPFASSLEVLHAIGTSVKHLGWLESHDKLPSMREVHLCRCSFITEDAMHGLLANCPDLRSLHVSWMVTDEEDDMNRSARDQEETLNCIGNFGHSLEELVFDTRTEAGQDMLRSTLARRSGTLSNTSKLKRLEMTSCALVKAMDISAAESQDNDTETFLPQGLEKIRILPTTESECPCFLDHLLILRLCNAGADTSLQYIMLPNDDRESAAIALACGWTVSRSDRQMTGDCVVLVKGSHPRKLGFTWNGCDGDEGFAGATEKWRAVLTPLLALAEPSSSERPDEKGAGNAIREASSGNIPEDLSISLSRCAV